MADLVIRGMEKPIDCHSCWMRVYCFERGIGVWGCGKGKPCPLVPIPEGHGRLIDADEFIERVRMDDRTTIIEEMHIAEILSEAPTIVPADVTDIDVGNKKEGGTENG